MDVSQARTFLEIAHTGSFQVAAQRLHVSQTAVSARIRALEDRLGSRLFVRNRAGARLTASGDRLEPLAAAMVRIWERARRQVALPPGRVEGVAIGGELSLWHPLLADLLIWLHRERPQIAVRVEVDGAQDLLARVEDGSLDVAVLYNPPSRRNLAAELLVEEKLVLVTTSPDARLIPEKYVYVDWGPAFAANHETAFPELGNPPVSVSLGPLALTYLLTVGGCGYFRLGAVESFLGEGRLRRVAEAPEFSHSAYAVYADRSDSEVIQNVRRGLKIVAEAPEQPGLPQPIAPRSRKSTDADETRPAR